MIKDKIYNRSDEYYIIHCHIYSKEDSYIDRDSDANDLLWTYFPHKAKEFEFEDEAYSFIIDYCENNECLGFAKQFSVFRVKRNLSIEYGQYPINDITRKTIEHREKRYKEKLETIEQFKNVGVEKSCRVQ